MQQYIDQIRALVVKHTGLEAEDVKIESPRDASLGDFAFPCFPLAKVLKQAPPKIAAELAEKLAAELKGVTVAATGPYLNFTIDRGGLARTIVTSIAEQGASYGGSDEGGGKTVLIDYSSPNIAKRFHVGHLRSTIIGGALKRLHDALGYRTVGINHIGDWGIQFGKLYAAVQRWGDEVDLEKDPLPTLHELYVRVHAEEKNDPELAEAGREAFRELEAGTPGPVREFWEYATRVSLAAYQKVYDRLGVSFDHVRGEAFYEPLLDDAVQRIVDSGVTEISEGALVVMLDDLKGKVPPCLLRKTDGTTLYATRDFAAVFSRWEEFAFDRCLYVVGQDQRLHFRQIKGVLARMGLDWEARIEHVDFGLLRLPEGKLSSRGGKNVVFLEDLLDAAVDEAGRIIEEKNPHLANKAEIAEQVGIGAVVFNDLKRERVRDVMFEWDDVLSFEGETGPYVQYTHARLASILRKAAENGLESPGSVEAVDFALLEDASEILLLLGRFPTVVASAAANCEPSEVTRYALELCRGINSWYVGHRVLGEDVELSRARLALVASAKTVLSNGLTLLGVAAPEEM